MQYIIDGTLLPCWSWAARPELYSGKHKTTGMNVQVACSLAGRLAWISDPVDGAATTTAIAWTNQKFSSQWIPVTGAGDKGYVGHGMITPFKKPAGGELPGWQKEFDTQVNKLRYVIEQVIANFKPGGSCIPTIGARSRLSLPPSRLLLLCTSTRSPE
jgi:hypothetical protein